MCMVLLLFITLIMLALMGDLLWLQYRAVAEPDRQREAERQRLAARRPGRYPPSYRSPIR